MKRERLLPFLLPVVALLPDLRAAIPDQTYYFRDFSLTYYPLRAFFAREAAQARFPFWNPYIHEGTFTLPVFYPPDLLHALWPGPAAVSWLLTVHLPLAALTSYALARELGASRLGAFAGGAAYALSGLSLSSLNLHWFLQSLALAPLVVALFRRAAVAGGRSIVWAGLVLGTSISTLAVEFVGQGLLAGLALGVVAQPRPRGLLRVAAAIALGLGLAGVPLAVTLGFLGETVRGGGFAHDLAMQQALHPAGLLQTLIPGFFGSLAAPLDLWWGGRFFNGGFPYFASLYVGSLTLAFALAGARSLPRRLGMTLLALGGLGLWYALGDWGGLAPLLSHLPVFSSLRFPSKGLLLPMLVLSLLAALGVDALREAPAWRWFRRGLTLAAMATAGFTAATIWAWPAVAAWMGKDPVVAAPMQMILGVACGQAVLVPILGLIVTAVVGRPHVGRARAVGLLVALLVVDLAQAGAGLNPQVSPRFFELLPEMKAERLDALDGGRVFSYGVDHSFALQTLLDRDAPGRGLWAFFLSRQALAPYNNVTDQVETAIDPDRLSVVPHASSLPPYLYNPLAVRGILGRLRNAAVSRIVSLDPLEHPALRLRSAFPAGPPGLALHVYELVDPWPRAYLACRVRVAGSRADALQRALSNDFDPARDVALETPGRATCRAGQVRRISATADSLAYGVDADGAGYLVIRDSYARGWRASVDGAPALVLRANGKHRAIALAAGRHQVVLRYHPPGLRAGLLAFSLAIVATVALAVRPILVEAEAQA